MTEKYPWIHGEQAVTELVADRALREVRCLPPIPTIPHHKGGDVIPHNPRSVLVGTRVSR